MRKLMTLIVFMISLLAIMLTACSTPVAVPEPTVMPTSEFEPGPQVSTISTPIGDFTYSQKYRPYKSNEGTNDGYMRLGFELRPYGKKITLNESYLYDFDNAQVAIGSDLYNAEGSNIVYTSGQIGKIDIWFIVEDYKEHDEAELILP